MNFNIQILEDSLWPESGKLIIDEDGGITAQIIDEELDEIGCEFNNDGCVNLNVEGLQYIVLSRENLELLIDMLDESEDVFRAKSERQ